MCGVNQFNYNVRTLCYTLLQVQMKQRTMDIWGKEVEEIRAYHIKESLRKRKEWDLSQSKKK